ncbi:hypothetical protein GEMRC1_012277 [Eukaryota sp. GEM-RC1]
MTSEESSFVPPPPRVIPPSPTLSERDRTPPGRSPEPYERRRPHARSNYSPPPRRRRIDDRDRRYDRYRPYSPVYDREPDPDRPLSFKAFCREQPSAPPATLQERYDDYLSEFQQTWAKEYFESHKSEEDFRKQYHPIEKEESTVHDVAIADIVKEESHLEPIIEGKEDQPRNVRCGIVECRKLFKGMEFMEKHFTRKHPELIEERKKQIEQDQYDEFLQNFLSDPNRPKPPSARDPSPSPMRSPPRRSYEPDPRAKEVVSYRDLDAPRRAEFSGLDYGL